MAAANVALAQLNATVGDFEGNARKIEQMARQAAANGADVLLTPEMALTGYPAEDLLLRPAFVERERVALLELTERLADLPGLAVVVGHLYAQGNDLYNTASVLVGGKVVARYFKRELPNYGVFDEKRYFVAGHEACVFEHAGMKFGVNICEDAWFRHAPQAAVAAGAQCLLVLNASPFHMGKFNQRLDMMRRCVDRAGVSLVYANLCGAQDELVFDGMSFALDKTGHCIGHAPAYDEAVALVAVQASGAVTAEHGDWMPLTSMEDEAEHDHLSMVWQALVVGTRDYVQKNGFKSVLLGLSGGIDSAVVLAIAVDALGADKVMAVMMPSRYTADISLTDAADMAARVGVRYEQVAIADIAQRFESALAPVFAGRTADTTEENIQARVRGTLLMAMSNKFGSLVLTTGNKSELTTGYCTLYGDMAGGFAVLKDVPKTLVYRLARWRNLRSAIIPDRIITRAPSAELRPDQTDQDSLPPYDVIDSIIAGYVDHNLPASRLIESGLDAEAVELVVRLLRINEYKRRQSAPGPKVTVRAFGRDWRYPLTNAFREIGA
ncbi:MAG: NAD+ synthase [Burkholderiaceae bacterium]|nr:NAD+ synthase [Burkholderiaceae bacterium]MCD8516788.1 NAD+ synthase [Burkholderiaceae bacterium]MCD8536674.1 NAD+ synthase [Burkholderiaceae bacterium]MCD8564383.1 NAD+ synthase [Burkholderiaceae bacterium]